MFGPGDVVRFAAEASQDSRTPALDVLVLGAGTDYALLLVERSG